jgi:hypothetical protein
MTHIDVRTAVSENYLRWYFNGYHYWMFSNASEKIATSGEKFSTSAKKMLTAGSLNLNLSEVTGLRSLLLSKDVQLYKSGDWINIKILPGSHIILNTEVNGYEIEINFECSI